jgi:hypothetical protein
LQKPAEISSAVGPSRASINSTQGKFGGRFSDSSGPQEKAAKKNRRGRIRLGRRRRTTRIPSNERNTGYESSEKHEWKPNDTCRTNPGLRIYTVHPKNPYDEIQEPAREFLLIKL